MAVRLRVRDHLVRNIRIAARPVLDENLLAPAAATLLARADEAIAPMPHAADVSTLGLAPIATAKAGRASMAVRQRSSSG